ncbi:MAG: LytR C-terminal domain-containing protein [Gemmatimonadetes bacterium]|nr:LytR C-terminal domain-containing protein [Gemmatimonadota bacterium]
MQRTLKAALFVVVGGGAVVLALSAIGQWIPDDTAPEGQPLLSRGAERITVDVLNAGGVDGMAKVATDHLRAAGFDVVKLGNASNFDQDSTVVIDRVGSLQKAAAVAEALGVRSVSSERDANLFVDVTVRLGSDWTTPAAEVGDEPEEDGLLNWLRRVTGQRETGSEKQ